MRAPDMRSGAHIVLPAPSGTGSVSVRIASGFFDRARGLLGTRTLASDAGLLLVPCASVHCAGMRYAIDVVFLDDTATVTRVVPGLRPWRSASHWRARAVLELAAGAAQAAGLAPGVVLHALQPHVRRVSLWRRLRPAATATTSAPADSNKALHDA